MSNKSKLSQFNVNTAVVGSKDKPKNINVKKDDDTFDSAKFASNKIGSGKK